MIQFLFYALCVTVLFVALLIVIAGSLWVLRLEFEQLLGRTIDVVEICKKITNRIKQVISTRKAKQNERDIGN